MNTPSLGKQPALIEQSKLSRENPERPGGSTLEVHTTSGWVRGVALDIPAPLATWRGVPYGASTAGANRFKAPHPAPIWLGIRDCFEYGHVAAQPTFGPSDKIKGSEDCLNLDIVRPDDNRKLPVVVYFHGGSFIFGSSHQQVLRGHYLVEAMDVVYVSINFRLGALGYLDYSSFGDDCVANPALLDQLLALKWVKNNIANFGGDPNNVTLMGESAGANSVTTLMCIAEAKGLFHKAIAQSAPVAAVHSVAQAAFWAKEITTRAGIDNPNLETLRALPPEVLIRAGQSMLWRSKELLNLNSCFGPVVDNELLPEHPLTVFRSGEEHKIPLMIGTNDDEASVTKTFYFRSKTRSKAAKRMLEGYDPQGAAVIMRTYQNATLRDDYAKLMSDGIFWAPSVITASAHSLNAPTWMYRFDFVPAALRWLGVGASHTAELSPVFGDLEGSKAATLNKLGSWNELKTLKEQMQNHWANFIHNSNPNAGDADLLSPENHWPAYRPPNGTSLGRATKVFDTTAYVVYDPKSARRVAWENYNMLQWGADRPDLLRGLLGAEPEVT